MKRKFTTIKAVVTVFFLLSVSMAFSQTARQKQQITSRYNISKLSQLKTKFLQQAEQKREAAYRMAKQKGWDIIKKNPNGSEDHLMAVSSDGKPIYYTIDNVDAARSTRADHLNTGGSLGLNLNGDNLTAHVWDGGPTRPTHQEFDGAGGNNRVSINDGNTTLDGNSFHAMHVTGTIVASGVVANAKGMAHHANALTHDWTNDLAEATTEAASGMLISNHSYGYRADLIPDWYFGAYMQESADWDALMYNSPNYLMVVAAGNDGNDNSSNGNPLNGQSSYDKLSGHATSKNNMVVANGQDANVNNDGTFNSVTINSSSSEGPTDDLRIKPDITGNGTGVYSTYDNADNAYNSISGTSMASPNVTGTLLLLQEHYNNLNSSFMRSSTLKGLALHTADDAGSAGPDVVYGWGLLNAKVAAEAITQRNSESKIDELTLSQGQTFTVDVESDGVNPLIASICWTDPAGTANTGTANLTTPALVNDLDIRVTKGGSTYNPYKLTSVSSNTTGDNNVDPYERVDVSGATGTYTITVTHKGSLSSGSQNFSLVVTGLTGTPIVCNATTPTGLAATGLGSSTATLSWDAVPGATYDLRYRVQGTSSWTTNAVSGSSSSLSGLTPTTTYEAQVRSKCDGGATSSYSSTVTFTTTEFSHTYCSSNGQSVSDEYIGRVQLGSIDNASGAGAGGYTDHTNIVTDLALSSSNTITITPTWTGTVYSEGYSVWIDYNYDGDFADAGEQVWTQSATQTTPVSGSFTVPASATVGQTTMRVSMKYNGVPTECESFSYGEVEDYSVNITGGGADTQAPSVPTGLAASGTTETSTNLTWTASTDNVGVTGYDIYVNGSLNGSSSSTSYTVTGLTVATTYSMTVRANDAAGNNSAQSSAINVTTVDQTAPSVPSGLSASNTTQTSTDLSWSASSDNVGVTGYDVYVNGSLNGSSATTSYTVTGLSASTTYSMTVRASDAAGNNSAQSSAINVTTQDNPGGGCSGGISSFPYTESFESGLGAWSQGSGDDIDWTRDASGTPSSQTGPSSATDGTYYLYTESSGNGTGFPNKVAILDGPCFDLSGESSATFGFAYHMYGASMGTLDLQASSNGGSSWTSVWSQSGDQGNSWQTASVDLSSYAGGTMQLRYVGTTGSSWRSDMTIDDLSLTTGGTPPAGNNITLTITFDNYPEETSWSLTSGGSTVASGGTYGSQADGSTLVIPITGLADGCYDFTINDSYGDGICCSYGNGSYTLTNDAGGATLASGGSFTSSETTNFCLSGTTSTNTVNTVNVVDRNDNSLESLDVNKLSFRAYPNPAINVLNVEAINFADDAILKIYDLTGAEVMATSIEETKQGSLDITSLKPGLFIITVFDKNNAILHRTKFIKQ